MRKLSMLTATAMLAGGCVFAETYPYQDEALSPTERAADLVSRMTLDEKIDQVGHNTDAISRLGVKGYNYWNEALHGVARSGLATSFPSSKAMSATWDLPLIFQTATAISDEARIYNNDKGKGLIYWCPTINMSRDPRWGRDEENYGEDPFLTGKIAVEYIKGMQGDDPRHYKTIATTQTFDVEEGTVDLYAAASSADLRLHQTISTEGATVKLTYKSDPSGISNIFADSTPDTDKVYNLTGICVGDPSDFDNLPGGFYILGGKKIVKK